MAENISDINGGNNDYATLALWESVKNGNITAGNAEVAEVYAGYSDNSATLCDLSGWTTDADSYIGIRAASSVHRSSSNPLRYGQAVSLLSDKSNGAVNIIYITSGANFVRIDGLDLAAQATSGGAPLIKIDLGSSTTIADIRISNCILTHLGSSKGYGIYVTELSDTTAHNIRIWNCIVYDCAAGVYTTNPGSTHIVSIYNCTFYGGTVNGIAHTQGVMSCYNVISYNNSGNDFNGTIGGDYNLSEDATAPGAHSLTSGTGSNNPAFVSTTGGSEDFSTQLTSNAIGTGIDNPGSGLYSDDINYTARTATWDIGAFENTTPTTTIKKAAGVAQASLKKAAGVAAASVKKIAGVA